MLPSHGVCVIEATNEAEIETTLPALVQLAPGCEVSVLGPQRCQLPCELWNILHVVMAI